MTRLAMAGAAGETPLADGGGDMAVASLPAVGVIRNRKSHRNKGHAIETPDHPGVDIVTPLTKQELEDTLARFSHERIGLLGISGGDGTIRDVLTRGAPAFGEKWPDLIILPQGKTNALAIDLGLPHQWDLASALEAAANGRRVRRRAMMIERLDASQRTQYGFILGAGVFNAAIDAGQVAHRFGAFQSFAIGVTVAFGIAQALFGFGKSPWRRNSAMHIRADGKPEELARSRHGAPGTRFLAGFTSLTRFPLGLRPFENPTDEAALHYLAMDAPLRRAVAVFPAFLYGRDFDFLAGIGLHRHSAGEYTASFADPFVLDGESFPPGEYRIRLGPELRFVVP